MYRRLTLLASSCALAFLLVACGGGDGGPTPPPEPRTGTIEVSASTAGATPDADGYAVTLDGGAGEALAADGSVTFDDVATGSHTLALGDLAVNCSVQGGAEREVSVAAGETATASFTVDCPAALFDELVFTSDENEDELFAAPPASGEAPRPLGMSFPFAEVFQPDVSPGGTHFVVVSADDLGFAQHVWTVRVDGTGLRQITDTGDFDGSPAFSPDGERIAFRRIDLAEGRDRLLIHDREAGTTETVPLPAGEFVSVDWLPDGDRVVIAFRESGEDREAYELQAVDVGTGDMEALTDDGVEDQELAVSPDDGTVVFVRVTNAGRALWLIESDGSDLRELVGSDQAGPMGDPAWGPAGERVYFEAHQAGSGGSGGNFNLLSIAADGTGLRVEVNRSESDQGVTATPLAEPGG